MSYVGEGDMNGGRVGRKELRKMEKKDHTTKCITIAFCVYIKLCL